MTTRNRSTPVRSATRKPRRASAGNRSPLRVAMCVFPISADADRNFAAIEGLARAAASNGARLAVFAEGALSGYYGEHFKNPDAINPSHVGELNRRLGSLARETGIHLVVGTLVAEGEARYNSLLAFSPAGRRLARYDKRHLTRQDHRYYTRGETPPALIRVDGWNVGLLLCFDARFSLWSHEYVRRGADVLVYSFNMCGKSGLWKRAPMEATLRTRAAENHVFVIGVNDGHRHPQIPALAIDRGGCTLVRAFPTTPTVLLADLDPAVSYRIGEEILAETPVDYPVAATWDRR